MLDPNVDYSELEAAAHKRWPDLVSPDGTGTSELKHEIGAVTLEAAPWMRGHAGTEMGVALGGELDIVSEQAIAKDQARIEREVIVRSSAPVFRIRNGAIDWDNALVGQRFWKDRLDAVEPVLKPRYPAIGRIEATLSPYGSEPLGTAWLIDRDVIVTNAHVARLFGQASGRGWRFRSQQGFDDRPMSAGFDNGENANESSKSFAVLDVLWISPHRDRDVAFLRIANGVEADPIEPFVGSLPERPDVVVIGYPERDETINVADLQRFFGDVWGWKRLAPGILGQVGATAIRHLCNTLGGNSGSPLLDLGTGKIIGLHYGGIPDRDSPVNYALPAQLVYSLLADLRAAGPVRNEGRLRVSETTGTSIVAGTIQIPLTLTIGLSHGGAAADDFSASLSLPGQIASAVPHADKLESAVAQARLAFAARADVLAVRPGWKVTGGVISDTPAIVVAVKDKEPLDELAAGGRTPLPASFAGFPIDITAACLEDLIEKEILVEAARRVAYRPRPGIELRRVTGRMKLEIAPGPDAGSGMLLDFLDRTERSLTVGMYEFTAPHIRDGLLAALDGNQRFAMVLQKGESIGGDGAKKDDIKDEQMVRELGAALGSRFTNQWSARAIHPAYHIKVAAQDDTALWLSSGSWQSSNQPQVRERGPHSKHNREMHVIVQNAEIAEVYRRHVEEDAIDAKAVIDQESPTLEQMFWVPASESGAVAETRLQPKFFAPLSIAPGDRELTVLPLLTPDNYTDELLKLIRGATKSILFHNQSFSIANTRADSFEALLTALKDKQLDPDIDVRIILRGNEGVIDARQDIEKMQTYGFRVDADHVRIQPKLHNKMWVFDGETSLIGSHNFTNQGTTINRDASLVFFDEPAIAAYCTEVFEHDWERLADRTLAERRRGARRARRGEIPPPGMRLTSAYELLQ